MAALQHTDTSHGTRQAINQPVIDAAQSILKSVDGVQLTPAAALACRLKTQQINKYCQNSSRCLAPEPAVTWLCNYSLYCSPGAFEGR